MNVGVLAELFECLLAMMGENELEFASADTPAEFLADKQLKVFFVVYHEEPDG